MQMEEAIKSQRMEGGFLLWFWAATVALGSFQRVVDGHYVVFYDPALGDFWRAEMPPSLGGTADPLTGRENKRLMLLHFRREFGRHRLEQLKRELVDWVPDSSDLPETDADSPREKR